MDNVTMGVGFLFIQKFSRGKGVSVKQPKFGTTNNKKQIINLE